MTPRERFIQFLTTLATIALSVVAARFGIPLPPPVVTIPPAPPPVHVTVPPPAPAIITPPSVLPVTPNPVVPQNPPPVVIVTHADPYNATVKLRARDHYCTGTIIGPKRTDGRYWLLSAGHCAGRIGEQQTAVFRDGRTLGVVVVTVNRQQDWSWYETDTVTGELPYAELSDTAPAIGSTVWHAGYGVWTPGQKESGKVQSAPDSRANVHIGVTVSSGDSGSGLFDSDTGKLVAVVSVGNGRNPSSWTEGPSTPTIRTPRPIDRGRLILPECPGGNCPIG